MAREGKNFKAFLFNQRTLAILGLAVLILIALPLFRNISQRYEISKEIKDTQNEINKIENKNNDLKNLIDYLGSKQYLEEKARLNFGLEKPGEQVVVVENSGQNQSSSSDNNAIFSLPKNQIQPASAGKNNVDRWISYFFKK